MLLWTSGEQTELLMELFSRVPWEFALEGSGVHKCWLVFKNRLLEAQEQQSHCVISHHCRKGVSGDGGPPALKLAGGLTL